MTTSANRDTETSIRAAGFEVEELVADQFEFDVPLVRPLIWGTARNPGDPHQTTSMS